MEASACTIGRRDSKPWLPDLNKRSKALFNKYPDPVRPYTEADMSWSDTE